MREVAVLPETGDFEERVEIGAHRLIADAEKALGGGDAGPDPHELLCAALGACTAMTVRLYARRKQWPLERAEVRVAVSPEGDAQVFRRAVTLSGPIDDEQRKRLLEIADKCPVHKLLTGKIRVETRQAP